MRTLFVAILVLVISGCGFSAQPVEPLVAGGQRFFTLEWQAGPRGAQRLVWGYIKNEWGFAAGNV
jgi:hypothetical protein